MYQVTEEQEKAFFNSLGIVFDGKTIAVCMDTDRNYNNDNIRYGLHDIKELEGKEIITSIGWGGSKALTVLSTCFKRLAFSNDYAMTLDGIRAFCHRMTTFGVHFFGLGASYVIWVKGPEGIEQYKFDLNDYNFKMFHLLNPEPFWHLPRTERLGRKLLKSGERPFEVCQIPVTTLFDENKRRHIVTFDVVSDDPGPRHWEGRTIQ